MTLTCPRCVGKVIVDTEYTYANHIEFSCLICGWRGIHANPKDKLILKILEEEKKRGRVNSGTSW